MRTDRAWQIWGSKDPYFAVLTHDRYRAGRLGPEDRKAFFGSGRAHVDMVLRGADALTGKGLSRGSALDFGCGVGRLVIPFAEQFDAVTGIDVSRAMLDEAGANCAEAGADNVTLLATAEFLAGDRRDYDLLHSALVFQHIRPADGERLLASLVDRVAPGGVVAIQFMFHRPGVRMALTWLRDRLPFGHALARWLHGRRREVAPMEMNPYDMNRVLVILEQRGFDRLRMIVSRDSGIGSVFVFGHRSRDGG
ncbi:MAG: class I SAM-dependent methyltransferase [Pseudomonadales bacterium]